MLNKRPVVFDDISKKITSLQTPCSSPRHMRKSTSPIDCEGTDIKPRLSKARFNSHAPQLAFGITTRSSKVFYLKNLFFLGTAVRYSDYKKKLLLGGEA